MFSLGYKARPLIVYPWETMREIKAVIRPGKLDALRQVPGFPGMTVSKAEGVSAPERMGDGLVWVTDVVRAAFVHNPPSAA